MSKPDYYREKIRALDVISCDDIKPHELAERVYYMYLAQQEQINELQQALAGAKPGSAPQPMSAGDGPDPCCCGGTGGPFCPPICVKCE